MAADCCNKYSLLTICGEAADASGDSSPSKAEQIAKLHEELERCREDMQHKTHHFDQMDRYWTTKQRGLRSEMEMIEERAVELEQELRVMTSPPETKRDPPPGPSCLLFLDTQAYEIFSCAVVACNVATTVLLILRHNTTEHSETYHQPIGVFFTFLAFYIVQLCLKAVLFQRTLLFGRCSTDSWSVWWNWLDLAIIVLGMVNFALGDLAYSQIFVAGLFARLLRVMKIAQIASTWDLSWTEGPRFQAFIMGVILLNSIIIAVEDYYPGLPCWSAANQVMLTVFAFELFVRFSHLGCKYFVQDVVWNWLDFIIVLGGVIDSWLQPLVAVLASSIASSHSHKKSSFAQFMMLLRLARLLRILRLVRLIKKVKPLYTLVVGITEAMQGMGWVVVLTVVWLYMGALLFVKLVGHGLIFGGEAPSEVQQIFPNVPTAMWVLFKVMNGDPGDLDFLFDLKPYFKLVIAIFMIISSWAILSILTAVVSENMIAATDKLATTESEEMAQQRSKSLREKLDAFFRDGDEDGDGHMTHEEFDALLSDTVRLEEICVATGVSRRTFEDLFYILSVGETTVKGERVSCIDRADFIEGLMMQGDAVNMRSLSRLEKRLVTVVREETRKNHSDIREMVQDLGDQFQAVASRLARLESNSAAGSDAVMSRLSSFQVRVVEDVSAVKGCVHALNEAQPAMIESVRKLDGLLRRFLKEEAQLGVPQSLQQMEVLLQETVRDQGPRKILPKDCRKKRSNTEASMISMSTATSLADPRRQASFHEECPPSPTSPAAASPSCEDGFGSPGLETSPRTAETACTGSAADEDAMLSDEGLSPNDAAEGRSKSGAPEAAAEELPR